MSRELTAILDREELFARIAQRVKTLVDYSLFAVMLWNEGTAQLENVFAVHYGEPLPVRFCVPLFKGITGNAAGERRRCGWMMCAQDPRYIEMPNSENVRSEMVIPLLLQDRLVGVLDLESIKVGAFTAENERLLGILSSYIAIALENSRLYVESREHEARLQSDLDTAREVQLQLLPQGVPDIPGLDVSASYLPARDLGGDFYDVMPYGERRAARGAGRRIGQRHGGGVVWIAGDWNAARKYAADGSQSGRNAGRAEPAIVRDRESVRDSWRMLFAVFNRRRRTFGDRNGGIPHPVLARDGEVKEIPIDGTPLGLFRRFRIQRAHRRYAAGRYCGAGVGRDYGIDECDGRAFWI